jgi:hypothetical protein
MCDQETSKNEEAKARYRVVENSTTMGYNAKKTNKQTSKQRMKVDEVSGGICHAWKRREMFTGHIWENLKI